MIRLTRRALALVALILMFAVAFGGRQRLRLIWHIARGDSLAVIAERLARLSRSDIEHFAETIAHMTQEVIRGMMGDMADHSDALGELSSRMTQLEINQRATLERIEAIDRRLARGDLRFEVIDAQIKAQHEAESPIDETE